MSDDYGNDGEVPDPSWSNQIGYLDPDVLEKYTADHASYGPLTRDQVSALLQHLPPPPAGYDAYPGVLASYVGAVMRWDEDVARGAVPSAPTPNELASWCDHNRCDLPLSFVKRLQELQATAPRLPQSNGFVRYPVWLGGQRLPVGLSAATKVPRGRPKIAAAINERLIKNANRRLLEQAHVGILLTIPQLAVALGKEPEFRHWSSSTIERRLNSNLLWTLARELAGKARN